MAWIKGNRYLSLSEMQNNAKIIYSYLIKRGWSKNAICGMLGNMEAESTINPGIWQGLIVGSGGGGGYGLVQWTPYTNFTNYADRNGFARDDGNAQLKWIDEHTIPFGQWIKTSSYNISFNDFKKSTNSVEWLASAFLKNFERAGVEVEAERRENARYWLNYINKLNNDDLPDTPDVPDTPDTPEQPETPDTPETPHRKLKNLSKLLLYAIATDEE